MLRDGPPDVAETSDSTRPQPTLSDVPELVDQARSAGMRVTLDSHLPDPTPPPEVVGRHAYRMVQEGLTNARRHAPGSAVQVRLAGAPGGELAVEVRNPLPVIASGGSGTHAFPGPSGGLGLIGLAERAALAEAAWNTDAMEPGSSSSAHGCPGRHDPGGDRGRRPARAGGAQVDPRWINGHRDRRGGGRRCGRSGCGRAVGTARGADGHPDAADGRAGGNRAADGRRVGPGGDRPDHVRRRRARAAGPAGRGERVPAQGNALRRRSWTRCAGWPRANPCCLRA